MYLCSKTILDCNTLLSVSTKSRSWSLSLVYNFPMAAVTKFSYLNKNKGFSSQAVPLGSLVSTLPMLPKSESQCCTGVAPFHTFTSRLSPWNTFPPFVPKPVKAQFNRHFGITPFLTQPQPQHPLPVNHFLSSTCLNYLALSYIGLYSS